jgi:Uma2 family endonuclease
MKSVNDERIVTADELLRRPRGRCREYLVRGRLVQQPFRSIGASRAATNLMVHLGNHVEQLGQGYVFGPCGFHLAWEPDTVLAPGVAFVHPPAGYQLSEGYHQGPPDLAAEFVCPSEEPHHLEVKLDEWLGARCPMVIVVDCWRRAATVYRSPTDVVLLTENDVIDGGDVVPGWRMPLSALFE